MLAPCLNAWTSIGKLLALKSCASRTLSRSSASSTVIFLRYMDENSSGSFDTTFALVWTGAGAGVGADTGAGEEEGGSCASVMETSPFCCAFYTPISQCSCNLKVRFVQIWRPHWSSWASCSSCSAEACRSHSQMTRFPLSKLAASNAPAMITITLSSALSLLLALAFIFSSCRRHLALLFRERKKSGRKV